MVRAALIGLAALLAGCETAKHSQARTGMLPEDAYPAGGGRVVVFRTAPFFMTLTATHVTPAITQAIRCQVLVQAVATSSTASLTVGRSSVHSGLVAATSWEFDPRNIERSNDDTILRGDIPLHQVPSA